MTDIGLISEDKEREETLENNKLITTIGRNPEQSISTHQHLECISLTLDKQTKTINNEAWIITNKYQLPMLHYFYEVL